LATPLAAESLANEIGEDHLAKRQLFPSFTEIRDISAHIGAAVADKAYELGKCIPHFFFFNFKLICWLWPKEIRPCIDKSHIYIMNVIKFE